MSKKVKHFYITRNQEILLYDCLESQLSKLDCDIDRSRETIESLEKSLELVEKNVLFPEEVSGIRILLANEKDFRKSLMKRFNLILSLAKKLDKTYHDFDCLAFYDC